MVDYMTTVKCPHCGGKALFIASLGLKFGQYYCKACEEAEE